MNNRNTQKTASNVLITLLTAVIFFHFCIVLKLFPYSIAWGGRLENDLQMYFFETFSILMNLVLIITLLLKNKTINHQFSDKIPDRILWFFISIFLLNTIGNLFAETNFEKYFAILTLLFALLIWLVVKRNKENKTNS